MILTVSAKMHVPLWPVPITMQTFAVLVIGATYGARLGALTVLLYLAEGALGLPVFSGTPEKGIGVAYMVGPAGGYLLGFLIAVAAVGWCANRRHFRTLAGSTLAIGLGIVAVYVPGVIWLSALIGIEKAIQLGILSFLPGDLLKGTLAVATFATLYRYGLGNRPSDPR